MITAVLIYVAAMSWLILRLDLAMKRATERRASVFLPSFPACPRSFDSVGPLRATERAGGIS